MRIVLLRNISSSLAQQVINQLFGGAVFFLLSGVLGKATFGDLNWCLAILLTGFGILSFGLDQLAIRKVAAGAPARSFLPQYTFHVLLAGGLFYAALLLLSHGRYWQILACLGGGKMLIFWSSPFKQVAAGREKFSLLAAMSVSSSVLKGLGLPALLVAHRVNLPNILYLFLAGDAAEFLLTMLLYRYRLRGSFNIARKGYKGLLKEALPQIGVVLSTSAMARFDWILIGWLLSDVLLADYSFAYKVFEVSTLPLLGIAPLLIPRFTRHHRESLGSKYYPVLRAEMLVCGLVMVLVNSAWAPVIGFLTAGKYGAGQVNTVFLLSLCTPLIYLNNFLWTILFAKGELKAIFSVIAVTCLVNLTLDGAFIPWLHNEGAALAYLAALGVQTVMYLRKTESGMLLYPVLLFSLLGVASVLLSAYIFHPGTLRVAASLLIYAGGVVLSGEVPVRDFRLSARLLNPTT